jgi:hypothetical protein
LESCTFARDGNQPDGKRLRIATKSINMVAFYSGERYESRIAPHHRNVEKSTCGAMSGDDRASRGRTRPNACEGRWNEIAPAGIGMIEADYSAAIAGEIERAPISREASASA